MASKNNHGLFCMHAERFAPKFLLSVNGQTPSFQAYMLCHLEFFYLKRQVIRALWTVRDVDSKITYLDVHVNYVVVLFEVH